MANYPKSKRVPAAPAPVKPTGRGLAEFRATHDKSYIVPKKIAAALAELGNAWENEDELMKRAKVGTKDFAVYREQFMADHAVELNGNNGNQKKRIWAGTKAFARKLRTLTAAQQ